MSFIIIFGTHSFTVPADSSINVHSKMHHLFTKFVSRHTKITMQKL